MYIDSMTDPIKRTDSYLLRLSPEERADLELICKDDQCQISEKLRSLVKKDAARVKDKKRQR
jgi:hypothetical protein